MQGAEEKMANPCPNALLTLREKISGINSISSRSWLLQFLKRHLRPTLRAEVSHDRLYEATGCFEMADFAWIQE